MISQHQRRCFEQFMLEMCLVDCRVRYLHHQLGPSASLIRWVQRTCTRQGVCFSPLFAYHILSKKSKHESISSVYFHLVCLSSSSFRFCDSRERLVGSASTRETTMTRVSHRRTNKVSRSHKKYTVRLFLYADPFCEAQGFRSGVGNCRQRCKRWKIFTMDLQEEGLTTSPHLGDCI